MKKFVMLIMGIFTILLLTGCSNKQSSNRNNNYLPNSNPSPTSSSFGNSTNSIGNTVSSETSSNNTEVSSKDSTAAPELTPVSEPTSTPEPTSVPEPTSTPEPTSVPEPTSTSEPTYVPEPTSTPEPTSVPEPTSTPEPTSVPESTSTPEPTYVPEPTATPEPTPTPEPVKNGKTLVAYFSWSGTSERIAQNIISNTGADSYRIERETPYSDDYSTVAYGEAKDEADNNARPSLKNSIDSIDEYDKIVLCYPIWWHTAPMTVGTFLNQFDFLGKTIYPVSQSASMDVSQYNQSVDFIKENAKNATVTEGIFTKNQAEIDNYLAQNGIE